jgi:hypothetical protein
MRGSCQYYPVNQRNGDNKRRNDILIMALSFFLDGKNLFAGRSHGRCAVFFSSWWVIQQEYPSIKKGLFIQSSGTSLNIHNLVRKTEKLNYLSPES